MYEGPEFRHLIHFHRCGRRVQYRQGSSELRTAQSNISRSLDQLEEGMNQTLFSRGRYGSGLTPAGRKFLPYAKEMVELRVRSVRATLNPHSGINLPLRFGYSPFINHDFVSAALKGFCELVPERKIEPMSECSGALINRFFRGFGHALRLRQTRHHRLWQEHRHEANGLHGQALPGPDPQAASEAAANPAPTMPPAPEAETEEEAAERKAEFERLRAEYEEEQQQREEERKQQFEQEQAKYEVERNRKAEIMQARETTLNRILENAPPTFTAAQLRVFLSALCNLDPYTITEDVADHFAGEDNDPSGLQRRFWQRHSHRHQTKS